MGPRAKLDEHFCFPPVIGSITTPIQPDWTCKECGRVYQDVRQPSKIQEWQEVKGPVKEK